MNYHHALTESIWEEVLYMMPQFLIFLRLLNNLILYYNFRQNYQKLVARDLLMGLRMDVNRPFGNSHDDNGNLVVDEPSEIQSGLETLKWNPNIRFDHDNDGLVKNNQGNLIDVNPQPRYHFAKQLYILLTKLVDGARIDVDGDGEATSRETAFLLAQWAVNVVDFRDPDAIMTPFEFDLNPLVRHTLLFCSQAGLGSEFR